jgi:hypothetical protein
VRIGITSSDDCTAQMRLQGARDWRPSSFTAYTPRVPADDGPEMAPLPSAGDQNLKQGTKTLTWIYKIT